jgi:hypothetical protein
MKGHFAVYFRPLGETMRKINCDLDIRNTIAEHLKLGKFVLMISSIGNLYLLKDFDGTIKFSSLDNKHGWMNESEGYFTSSNDFYSFNSEQDFTACMLRNALNLKKISFKLTPFDVIVKELDNKKYVVAKLVSCNQKRIVRKAGEFLHLFDKFGNNVGVLSPTCKSFKYDYELYSMDNEFRMWEWLHK